MQVVFDCLLRPKKIILHPDGRWNDLRLGDRLSLFDYDIALLELEEEDKLDLEIYTPACMANPEDLHSFSYKQATVAGWGYIQEDPILLPNVPYHVEVKIKPWSDCMYPCNYDDGSIDVCYSETHICTWWEGGGQTPCRVSASRHSDS